MISSAWWGLGWLALAKRAANTTGINGEAHLSQKIWLSAHFSASWLLIPIRTLAENLSQNFWKIFCRKIAANISYFSKPHRISEECWAGSWWRVNATWDKLRISSITDIESFAYFYILGSPPPTPRCKFCHETSSCKKDMARVKLPFFILLRIQAREFFTK